MNLMFLFDFVHVYNLIEKHYRLGGQKLFEIQGKEQKGYHCRENHKRSGKIVR